MRSTDFLIVGQGLCGTWLSYYLLQAGASVVVVDEGAMKSASSAASGIINPVTGKRLARQWMGETILPFAAEAYEALGRERGVALAAETSVHHFFSSPEEGALFEPKAAGEGGSYLHYNSLLPAAGAFNAHYGSGTIHPAHLVDVPRVLSLWRQELAIRGALIEAAFDWSACVIGPEDGVAWNGIVAKAVIDCSGAAAAANPYFERLPFALNKGEAIIADIPGLPRGEVYKYANLSIVPWGEGERFWLGSTFDWDFTDKLPTAAFRQKAEAILSGWLRLPYTFHEHFAAIRPATVSRDAFAGLHPHYRSVGILNGTGSKGCSLAPFLAHNLAVHLVSGAPLIAQVDVARYARALSR